MGNIFVENYENLSDNQLITLFNGGNDEAFSAILKRYSGMVLSRASSYVHKYDFLESDDLYQEGMIAVYFAVKAYDFESAAFSTFARLCVDRAIISLVRKALSKKSVPPQMLVELDDAADGIALGPEQICLSKEKLSEFYEKLRRVLSNKEYDVLKAHILGLSYSQIAKKLNITEKSVDNALCRIKQKLK